MTPLSPDLHEIPIVPIWDRHVAIWDVSPQLQTVSSLDGRAKPEVGTMGGGSIEWRRMYQKNLEKTCPYTLSPLRWG